MKVLEVSEPQGDSAETFKPAVDGLDGSVGGAHVEVGEDLAVSLPQRPAQLSELGQLLGYPGPDRTREFVHCDLALPLARGLVGGDEPLVKEVGDLDC